MNVESCRVGKGKIIDGKIITKNCKFEAVSRKKIAMKWGQVTARGGGRSDFGISSTEDR